MNTTLRRLALSALIAAPFLATSTVSAQTPTREGTTITNIATASFTDANGNQYANVTAQASIVVGFMVSLDISASTAITPSAPSTGNELVYTIANNGNGIDNIVLTPTVPAGIVVTGYVFNGTTYASIESLNTALATYGFEPQTSVEVTMVYDVLLGYGGSTLPVAMQVQSLRDANGAGTDSTPTTVSPPMLTSFTLTPDGGNVNRLPSNGTTYSEVFTITNTGNRQDTYSLTSSNGTVLTIGSVNGTTGLSSSITVAAGATQTFTVIYSVSEVAAGSSQQLAVAAVSSNDAAVTEEGHYTISVIKAALAMTKSAFMENQTTPITGNVLPGQVVWYRLTITNNGAAPAKSVQIIDPLPTQLNYVSSNGTGWTTSELSGTVTANLGSDLAPGASATVWIKTTIK
jgi:uncharacterized repeat protein (TIGR01451 family)